MLFNPFAGRKRAPVDEPTPEKVIEVLGEPDAPEEIIEEVVESTDTAKTDVAKVTDTERGVSDGTPAKTKDAGDKTPVKKRGKQT